jgi:uncharacterized protein DUF4886
VAGISIFVGLVQLGLIQDPLAPVIRGDLVSARSDRDGLRVLFVGNSFTYYNSMPALVQRLASADQGAQPIIVSMTRGAWTLQRFSGNDRLAALLKDVRWDVVILQEQSQLLSFSPESRRRETFPYARALQTKIESAGGRTLVFTTWAYEDGDRRNVPGDTFAAMQARLEQGYADLAATLSTPVAPVGRAWAEALRREPGIDLWAGDGRHPSRLGSYLTACVFYAILTGRDPAASGFTAGIGPNEARFLQQVATDVVASR